MEEDQRVGGVGGGYQNGWSDMFWDVHIFCVRNGGLELDLCGMPQANIGLIVLQKKSHWGLYIQELAGYRVVALDIPIWHYIGVAIFYWKFMQICV